MTGIWARRDRNFGRFYNSEEGLVVLFIKYFLHTWFMKLD